MAIRFRANFYWGALVDVYGASTFYRRHRHGFVRTIGEAFRIRKVLADIAAVF